MVVHHAEVVYHVEGGGRATTNTWLVIAHAEEEAEASDRAVEEAEASDRAVEEAEASDRQVVPSWGIWTPDQQKDWTKRTVMRKMIKKISINVKKINIGYYM